MEKKLNKGDVVWAKVKGFPWWPGVVVKVTRGGDVIVNFIGDESHAELPMSKVCKFMSHYDEFSDTKHKRLLHSIKLAERIHKGEITYDKHLNTKESEESSNNDLSDSEISGTDIIENKKQLLSIYCFT